MAKANRDGRFLGRIEEVAAAVEQAVMAPTPETRHLMGIAPYDTRLWASDSCMQWPLIVRGCKACCRIPKKHLLQ